MSILVFILSIISVLTFGYGLGYGDYCNWISYDRYVIANPLMLAISAIAFLVAAVICLVRYKTLLAIFEILFTVFTILFMLFAKYSMIDIQIAFVSCYISLIGLILWLIFINFGESEDAPYKQEEKEYEIRTINSKKYINGKLNWTILFGIINGNIKTDEVYNIYYYTDERKKKIKMMELFHKETSIVPLESGSVCYLVKTTETSKVIKSFHKELKVSGEVETISFEIHIPERMIPEILKE